MHRALRLGLAVLASATVAQSASKPPYTRTPEVGLSASVGYDDNVYGIDTGPLAKVDSLFVSASARIAHAPLPGLSLVYAPVATRYYDASREDNIKQTLSAVWKGRAEDLSWRAATDLGYVNGDRRGNDYGPGHGNAFSTAIPRERREQFQNKTDLFLRQEVGAGFVRALGRLAYWDMRTRPLATCNYVDRYDVQGGLDFGRVLGEAKSTEVYLGYRRGYQFQDRDGNPASPRHSSNHYHRVVIGGEGRLAKSLTLGGEVGWSEHTFSKDPVVYAGARGEHDFYADLTLTWKAGAKDDVQFKSAQYRTFSTTGVNNFLYTQQQISWKRVLDASWSTTLAARATEVDYVPALRDDIVYGFSAMVTRRIDKNWSASVTVNTDFGRELHSAIVGAAAAAREFDRTVVTLAVNWKR